jgi:mannosyltransferase OCH1-like enzyme
MIHYFKDGDPGYDYMDSWQKNAGHMEFKKWDSTNLPYSQYPILEKYRDQKKWSILSDFVRRWALLEFGGIYLDLDVELIKPIDTFLDLECFIAIEGPPVFGNMAVSGGHKGSKHLQRLLEMYLEVIEGKRNYSVRMEVACSPWVVTDYLKQLKGRELEEDDLYNIKEYNGLTTLPKTYFYPFNWNEQYTDDVIKPNTYGIHWWKKGW